MTILQKKAIITIEVLIALIILFGAIVTTTTAIKNLNIFNFKKDFYIQNYIVVNNIRSLLTNKILNQQGNKFDGDICGYKYSIDCIPKKSKRTYITAETKTMTGNFGSYNIVLFECKVIATNDNRMINELFNTIRYYKVKQDE